MGRVLVVDDEEPVRQVVRQIVERLGHAVEEAADGEGALALYLRRPHDLIITDILMPRVGGLKLLQHLDRRVPKPRAIVMSGGAEGGQLTFLATAATFDGVRTLKKPFSVAVLTEMIRDLLP